MKTNKYVTSQIHDFFTSLGFIDEIDSYYHPATCIWLHYMKGPTAKLRTFKPRGLDKVVVVSDAVPKATLEQYQDLEFDVIRIADLPQFVLNRAFGDENLDFRRAKDQLMAAEKRLDTAEVALWRSKEKCRFNETKINTALHAIDKANLHFQGVTKPPRFRATTV